MDYIKQLNAFELWLETNYLPGVSQLIWYKLFMLFNRCGWVEWVTVDNCRLMALADIKSETTFITNRDKLLGGLIDYQKGKKGSPNKYKMIQLYTIENTPKNEANNVYTPKNGANTELIRSENASQNGVETLDINKLNKTKQNKTNNNPLNPPSGKGESFEPKPLSQAEQTKAELRAIRDSFTFGMELSRAVNDWLKYKHERNQPYKPTGLKSLLTQIKNNAAKHSEQLVSYAIYESMASNYQGIVWDKAKTQNNQYIKQEQSLTGIEKLRQKMQKERNLEECGIIDV